MPSERTLAAELGVGRPAVREALKRLEQAGLIRIAHGGTTEVLDWRETAGLEILGDVAAGSAVPAAEIARSMIEMRAIVGIDAARHCAERASDQELAEIAQLAEQAAAAVGDDQLLEDKYAQTWRAIVVGSKNIAYLLAFTSLMRTLEQYPDVAAAVRPTSAKQIRALGAAVSGGDPAAAVSAAAKLLDAAAAERNWSDHFC